MADNLTAEVGAIQGLANKVSGYASEVRGLSTPNVDSCASGVSGSDIASACEGQTATMSNQKTRVAGRMEQFMSLCENAGKSYLDTEEEISSGFKAMGQL